MARQVWLGNSRGNTYARRHVSLESSSDAFWDFTWWAPPSSAWICEWCVEGLLKVGMHTRQAGSSHAMYAEERVSVSTAGMLGLA